MKRLVKEATNRKAKKIYNVEDLIRWYIYELEDNYPVVTKNMKSYKAELAKLGNNATLKLNMKILFHCAFSTDNEKLKELLSKRNIGYVSAMIMKSKNAKYIYDFVNLLVDIKDSSEEFENLEIDFAKYSQAIAETGDLKFNRYWIESFSEFEENYNLLFNSNDAESALFLAQNFDLSKEDFKTCENVVLQAKNGKLSRAFVELDGANKTKHRKIVIDSKDAMANSEFLLNKKCTVKQASEHKAAIYTSSDDNKLKAIVRAFVEKPEMFSQNEINDLVKNIIKLKNAKLARALLLSASISANNKTKLEQLVLNSKDVSAVRSLIDPNTEPDLKQKSRERVKELSSI